MVVRSGMTGETLSICDTLSGVLQGDGTEEVVACSWDGQTYFVNLSKEVVRFHFRENVAAFCAGE